MPRRFFCKIFFLESPIHEWCKQVARRPHEVGLYRGPYFATMELQARWACGTFSGRLPRLTEATKCGECTVDIGKTSQTPRCGLSQRTNSRNLGPSLSKALVERSISQEEMQEALLEQVKIRSLAGTEAEKFCQVILNKIIYIYIYHIYIMKI